MWLPRRVVRALTVALAAAVMLAGCSSAKSKSTTGKTTNVTTVSDKYVQLGIAAQSAGRLDEAIGDYTKAVQADPTNKFAFYDLGVIYQQLNDVTNASASYLKALQIDPKYKPAIFNLAILRTPIDPSSAVDLYRQLLALNADDANVLFNLGLLLRQLGQTFEGNADIQKAVQINPQLASRIPPTSTTPATTVTATTRR